MSLSVVSVILACVALMVLYYFDFEPFYSAVIAVLILVVFNGLNAIETVTTTMISGGANMLATMIPLILPGAVLAEVYTKTGAAESLANFLAKLVGKLFKDSFKSRLHAALITIAIVSIILMLGGLNGFVTMFATYPIVLSLLKSLDLPRRYTPALVFGLTTSAMQMLPGSPQLYNAVANAVVSKVTGQSLSAAACLIPGLIGSALMLVASYIYLYVALLREHNKGNGYVPGMGDPVEVQDGTPKANPILALIPLVFVFCMYNFFKLNLGVTCTLAFIIAILLFVKKFHGFKDVITVIAEGIRKASYSLIIALAISGFGVVLNSTSGYQSITDALLAGSSSVPLFGLALALFVLVGLQGNGVSGMQVALPGLTGKLFAAGVDAGAIQRVAATAATTLETIPTNTALITLNKMIGTKQRDTYGPVFITTVLITTIVTVIVALLCTIMV